MTPYLHRLAVVKPLYDNFGEEAFKKPVLGFFGKRDEQKLSIIREIFGIDIEDAKINILAYGENTHISYGLLDIYKLEIEELMNIIVYESEDEEFMEYCNRVVVYIDSSLINKIEEYAKKSSLIIIGELLDSELIDKIEKEILPKYPELKIKPFLVKKEGIDDMLYKAWLYDIREELLNKEVISGNSGFIEYVYLKISINKKYKSSYTSKTLGKHDDIITSISFSPDGKYLASGSKDKTIKIWSVRDLKEITTLKSHNGAVYSVAFSPKGKYLASSGEDGTIKIWSVNDWKEIVNLPHNKPVEAVSFSPDEKYLASIVKRETIRVWSVDNWKEVIALNYHFPPNNILFSPNGKHLAIVYNIVYYYNEYDSSNKTLIRILSSENMEFIRILSSEDMEVINSMSYDYYLLYSISFSPDGKYFAVASKEGVIKIWSTENWKEITTLKEDRDTTYSISFSPDGKCLASAGSDAIIKIWDLDNKEEIATLKEHQGSVKAVCFSPDGKYLASAGDDKTVKVWFIDLSYFEKNLPEILNDLKDIALLSSLQKITGKNIQNRKSIVFFGEFSSGKTTIINNLFELNLPIDILPSTAVPTIITYGQSKKLYLINTFFDIEEIEEENLEKISHQNKQYAKRYLYKIILLDKPALKDYIIIDTPGFSADSLDYKTAIDILNLADKLVYVIDAETGSITETGLKILKSIKDLDCMVILNKIDKKKEDFEKIVKYNKEILKNNGINAEIELFSSFLDEKLIKNWKLSIMSELLKKSKNSRFAEYYRKIYDKHTEFFS
ncbi:MAG: dynamin family protein [candidate division WOR-3 bacterium]|nr:dynamin family protein [candidate division WOR-3 bacterium]